jgi:anti-anti-sigma factor
MIDTPRNPEFDLRVDRQRSAVILRLSGELDLVGAERVDSCVDELVRDPPDELVIDLRAVTFMDSMGLRSLIRARAKGADAKLPVKLVRGSDQVQRVMTMTRMDDHFEFVEPSADEG